MRVGGGLRRGQGRVRSRVHTSLRPDGEGPPGWHGIFGFARPWLQRGLCCLTLGKPGSGEELTHAGAIHDVSAPKSCCHSAKQ